jgi:hypothetical protein
MNADPSPPTPTDAADAADAAPGAAPALADWLAAARADAGQRVAPAWLEAQLVTRFEEKHALAALAASRAAAQAQHAPAARAAAAARRAGESPGHRAPRRLGWFGWWLAAPAFALLAVAVGLVVLAPADLGPDPTRVVEGGAVERARFIALAPLDDIAADKAPRVVSARIPRAAVASFGLPVDPARADQPLNAELLVSARGVVLGVRFVD